MTAGKTTYFTTYAKSIMTSKLTKANVLCIFVSSYNFILYSTLYLNSINAGYFKSTPTTGHNICWRKKIKQKTLFICGQWLTFFPEKSLESEFPLLPNINMEFLCKSLKLAFKQGFELLTHSCSKHHFTSIKCLSTLRITQKKSLAYFQKDAKSGERWRGIQCLNPFCKLK